MPWPRLVKSSPTPTALPRRCRSMRPRSLRPGSPGPWAQPVAAPGSPPISLTACQLRRWPLLMLSHHPTGRWPSATCTTSSPTDLNKSSASSVPPTCHRKCPDTDTGQLRPTQPTHPVVVSPHDPQRFFALKANNPSPAWHCPPSTANMHHGNNTSWHCTTWNSQHCGHTESD